MLLKVTHSPFVAAIWAYERGYRYMSRKVGRSSPLLPNGPSFLSSQNKSRLSRNRSLNAMFRAPALRSDEPLVRAPKIHTRTGLRGPTSADKTDESIAELKQMIEKLSSQVQELSATIARRPDE